MYPPNGAIGPHSNGTSAVSGHSRVPLNSAHQRCCLHRRIVWSDVPQGASVFLGAIDDGLLGSARGQQQGVHLFEHYPVDRERCAEPERTHRVIECL